MLRVHKVALVRGRKEVLKKQFKSDSCIAGYLWAILETIELILVLQFTSLLIYGVLQES